MFHSHGYIQVINRLDGRKGNTEDTHKKRNKKKRKKPTSLLLASVHFTHDSRISQTWNESHFSLQLALTPHMM